MKVYYIAVILLLAGSAQAATLSVCFDGCEHSSIQAAINDAVAGDTIEVHGGTYNEDVVINKDVQLVYLDTVVVKRLFKCGHEVQGSQIAAVVSDGCNPEALEGHVYGNSIIIGGKTIVDDTPQNSYDDFQAPSEQSSPEILSLTQKPIKAVSNAKEKGYSSDMRLGEVGKKPATSSTGAEYQILDHSLGKAIDKMRSGNEIADRSNTFSTQDQMIYSWVKFGPTSSAHEVKWIWYSPGGEEFVRATYNTSLAQSADSDISHQAWCSLNPAWNNGRSTVSNMPGNWHVDIYIDDKFILDEEFIVVDQRDIRAVTEASGPTSIRPVDYTMSSLVGGAEDSYNVVTRTNSFSTADSSANCWLKFENVTAKHVIEWRWFSPDGNLYYTGIRDIPAPKDTWEVYNINSYINISGYRPEKMPGDWRVDIYIDGQFFATQEFTIGS